MRRRLFRWRGFSRAGGDRGRERPRRSGDRLQRSLRRRDGAQALLDLMVRELDGKPLFDLADANGSHPIGVKLPNGASFTLETGGALEYASKPSASLVQTVRVAEADLLQTAAIAERLGIALLSGACLPFTPRAKIPWIPKPRVKVMRDYFSQLGESGKHADAVMGVTLSTQTSLDYLSGQDFMDKLRLHVLAAPIVSALFVNSPIADGGYSGVCPGGCSIGRDSILDAAEYSSSR